MDNPAASSSDLEVQSGCAELLTQSDAVQGRAVQKGASNTLPQSPASLWLACAPLPVGPGLVHGLGVHAEVYSRLCRCCKGRKCRLALGWFTAW